MKIAIVSEWFAPHAGGVATHVRDLAKYLSRFCEVEIITNKRERNHFKVPLKIREIPGIKEPFFRQNVSPLASKKFDEILSTENYSIVHSHHIFARISLLALRKARKWGVKGVITNHTVTFWDDAELLWSAFSRGYPVVSKSLEMADGMISVSSSAKNFAEYFARIDRHVVIPNGVDTERFRPVDKYLARERMGLEYDKIVLYVGRLAPKKGVHTLIKAMKGIDAHLLIAGEGPMEKFLKSYARSIKANNISFLGYVSDDKLPLLYSAADLFVLPSIGGESFGMVLIEALASGTPVIGTEVGGIPEVLMHGRLGMMVPPGDWKKLKESIKSALKKPPEVDRALVESRYSWRSVSRAVFEFYNDILSNQTVEN